MMGENVGVTVIVAVIGLEDSVSAFFFFFHQGLNPSYT